MSLITNNQILDLKNQANEPFMQRGKDRNAKHVEFIL